MVPNPLKKCSIVFVYKLLMNMGRFKWFLIFQYIIIAR